MNTIESNNPPQKPTRVAHIQRADRLHVVVNDPFLDWLIILILAFATVLTLVAIGGAVMLIRGRGSRRRHRWRRGAACPRSTRRRSAIS